MKCLLWLQWRKGGNLSLQQEHASTEGVAEPDSALQSASFDSSMVESLASATVDDYHKSLPANQKAWLAERLAAILQQWIQHGPSTLNLQGPAAATIQEETTGPTIQEIVAEGSTGIDKAMADPDLEDSTQAEQVVG